jgi:PhnB protein
MWGQVSAPNGFRVMAYDVPATRPWDRGQAPFFVSVRADDAEELSQYWARLSEGATVAVELAPAQWAPLYEMLTDRFGITWVLDATTPYGG